MFIIAGKIAIIVALLFALVLGIGLLGRPWPKPVGQYLSIILIVQVLLFIASLIVMVVTY